MRVDVIAGGGSGDETALAFRRVAMVLASRFDGTHSTPDRRLALAPIIARVMVKTGLAAAAAGVVVSAQVAMAPAVAASPPPKPTTDPKQVLFVKYLVDHGVPYTSVPAAIKLAHTTCLILGTRSPTRIQDAATTIGDSVDMRPEQIQAFAAAAIGVYCPDVKLN
jgi:hypothetical protein